MKFEYETSRLLMKILPETYACSVLSFYERNQAHLDPWEPSKNHLFYQLPFHRANLAYEYQEAVLQHSLRYFIFLKEEPDTIIGCIAIQNILRGAYKSCMLGYKIDEAHTRNGYAFEALTEIIFHIFKDMQLHRIEAYIHPKNSPSIHLIEKLGFQYEGIATSYIKLNDVYCDHLRYSLINPYDE